MNDVCGVTVYFPSNVSECYKSIADLSRYAGTGVWNDTFRAATTMTPSEYPSQDALPSTTTVQASSISLVEHGWSLETIVQLYFISILIAFGVIGNVVSIIVLRQDRERRDTLFLLQALAVADALYLLVAIMRYPVPHLVKQRLDGSNPAVDMQPIVFPLLKTFQTIAVWMMVLVTIDRFTCVCRPLDAPRWFNPLTRPRYALGVLIAGFVYNIPRFMDSCVHRVVNRCANNLTFNLKIYRESFNNIYYFNIYIDGLTILLIYIGPLIALIVMTVRLIRAIRQSRRRRRCQDSRTSSSRTWSPSNDVILLQQIHHHQQQQQLQQQQQQQQSSTSISPPASTSSDRNATIVLIIIVVVFIVCETPELVYKLITFFERNVDINLDYAKHRAGLRILGAISELLMVVNSSVNFVVYVTFGRRFRRIMRETFRFSFRFSSDATAVTRDSPQGGAGAQPVVGPWPGHHNQQQQQQQQQQQLPHHQHHHHQPQYPMRFNYAATPGVRQYHQRGPPPQAIMLRTAGHYSNHNGI